MAVAPQHQLDPVVLATRYLAEISDTVRGYKSAHGPSLHSWPQGWQ
jgi:hypothetical protein